MSPIRQILISVSCHPPLSTSTSRFKYTARFNSPAMSRTSIRIAVCLLVLVSLAAAQQAFDPIAKFPLSTSPLTITQIANSCRPFSVAGEHGALLGQQDGTFELWSFPYKFLQHTHLLAELDGYGVPIDITSEASTIEVSPDHTTV